MKKNFILRSTVFVVICAFIVSASSIMLLPSSGYAIDPPNIIIINADNMGWADWCANPDPNAKMSGNNPNAQSTTSSVCVNNGSNTPQLNTLTAGGVSFTNFHASTPNCSPSRASLLTGRHAHRHGVNNNNLSFASSETTLAKVLKDLVGYNYETMAIGKWHLGVTPYTLPGGKGFDKYYVFPFGNDPNLHGLCAVEPPTHTGDPYNSNYYVTRDFNDFNFGELPCVNADGTDHKSGITWWAYANKNNWTDLASIQNDRPDLNKRNPPTTTYSTTEILSYMTITFINQHISDSQTKNNPFFVYLAYTAPHGTYDVDLRDGQQTFMATLQAPPYSCSTSSCYFQNGLREPFYSNVIKLIDDSVGDIIRYLDIHNDPRNSAKPISDNTIIIFISDNGAELDADLGYIGDATKGIDKGSQGNFFGGYRHVFEGGTRVPFIVKWPAGGWVTRTSDQLSEMTDIFTTLVHAAQVNNTDWTTVLSDKKPIDGIDLSSILTNPGTYTEKNLQYYSIFDLVSTYKRTGVSPDPHSIPYAIQTFSPSDASTQNGWKLFLDLDLNAKQLISMASATISLEAENADAVGEPLKKSSLKDLAKTYSDDIAYSSRFYFPGGANGVYPGDSYWEGNWYDTRSNRNINHVLSIQPRGGANEILDHLNVSVRFLSQNGDEVGYCNFPYNTADPNMLSIDKLCKSESWTEPCKKSQVVPSCVSQGTFTGTVAVYTDKPAYVTLYPVDKNYYYAALSTAATKTEHYFPKVNDVPPSYVNVMRMWNPSNQDIPVAIYCYDNNGIKQSEILSFQLDSRATYVNSPTNLCGNSFSGKGSVVLKASSPFAAVMESKVSGSGASTNRAFYQSPDSSNELYFPYLLDGTKSTITSTNWVTIYNPTDSSIDITIELWDLNGAFNNRSTQSLTAHKKYTFSPKSLINPSLSYFEGSVKVVCNTADNKIAGITDAAINGKTYDFYRAFVGWDDTPNSDNPSFTKDIPISKSLVFPRVTNTGAETTDLYIRNNSALPQDITFTLFNKKGEFISSSIVQALSAQSFTTFTPTTPTIFDGLVRVDSPDTISGIAYSKYNNGSLVSSNIYEAVPVKNYFPESREFPADGNKTIKLTVFDTLPYPRPQIVSWRKASDESNPPRGAIINRGSYFDYTPPDNYSGKDAFEYDATTETGDVRTIKVTIAGINTIPLDVTPPTTTALPAGGAYKSTITVTLNATDPGSGVSGVKEIHYKMGSGAETVVNGATASVQITATSTLTYYAIDKAGNNEVPNTKDYIIDTTKPVTAPLATGTTGTNGWYTSDVTVTFNATDTGSGVKEIHYKVGSGSETIVSSGTSTIIKATSTITYYAIDNAGNIETTKTLAINIDKVAPGAPTFSTLTALSPGVGLIATWKAAVDNTGGSGIASYDVYKSTSSKGTYTRVNTAPITTLTYTDTTILFNTTYYYYIKAVDKAGNVSAASAPKNAKDSAR